MLFVGGIAPGGSPHPLPSRRACHPPMLDYPLARLQGAIDAGATLTVRSDGQTLEATLRSVHGLSEISATGPDLQSVASELIAVWFAYNGLERPRDNGEGPLRPHMRAALGELGERHGSVGHDGYQTPGCECDYCSAYAVAFNRSAELAGVAVVAGSTLERSMPHDIGHDPIDLDAE